MLCLYQMLSFSSQDATQMTETAEKHCVLVAAPNLHIPLPTLFLRTPGHSLTMQNANAENADRESVTPSCLADGETVAKAFAQVS